MSTLRVNTLQDVAGTGQPAMPGAAKAWVNFDGTGVFSPNPSTTKIRAAFNVSSITDNGTGDYTVNFTTALADANYAVTSMAGGFGSGNTVVAFYESTSTARTASLVRMQSSQGISPIDSSISSVAIFR